MQFRNFSNLGWQVSDLNEIGQVMSQINSIYVEMIKEDIHYRW